MTRIELDAIQCENEYLRRRITEMEKELQSYVEMTAKEAKRVTIDKACEWIERYFPQEVDGYQFEFVKRETIIADFRKAMEE